MYKSFKEYCEFRENLTAPKPVTKMDPVKTRKISQNLAKTISSMPGDRAMDAITGIDQQDQKELVAKTLDKTDGDNGLTNIGDITSMLGIQPKINTNSYMKKK